MDAKMSITVLPARKNASSTNKDEENPKLRVAAYCRVSTDSDEQATSYDAQIEHYTNSSTVIRTGSWRVFSRTTVFPAPTPKSAMNSTA